MFGWALRTLILGAVRRCAQMRLPQALDRPAAWFAVGGIWAYRFTLSPFIGNDCLFDPTCSRFAEAQLRAKGWRSGWRAAAARLEDCGGDHDVMVLADGSIRLTASSGRTYDGESLAAPLLAERQRGDVRQHQHR